MDRDIIEEEFKKSNLCWHENTGEEVIEFALHRANIARNEALEEVAKACEIIADNTESSEEAIFSISCAIAIRALKTKD